MTRIADLVAEHDRLRKGGVNLIASENALPERAAAHLASDLQGRYHSTWYGGTSVVRRLIERVEELACELFRARHAVVSSLSGNLCDLAAILAFTEPGDGIGILPFTAGGYPMDFARFGRKRFDLAVKPGTFEPDGPATRFSEKPAMVVAGASFIPFPHDLASLQSLCRPLIYDGSHVMGLIAGNVFQDPLREGADVLIGSTHKSMFGPQGGLVLTNDATLDAAFRAELDFTMEKGISLVDNPHPGRIAALGAVLEMLLEDPGYGKRVVANAKALGAALLERDVPVRFAQRGFTESHQVFLDLPDEQAKAYCDQLEAQGIFIDIGGRLGTAELTTRGMTPDDMSGIADRMAAVYGAMG